MLERRPNYDVLLVGFAREHLGREFVWGETDCATLVREGLRRIMAEDPFPTLSPWSSLRGARGRYKQASPEIVLRDAGAREVGIQYAAVGDVALGPGGDDEGLPQLSLVLTHRKILISTPETGVTTSVVEKLIEGTRVFRL